MTTETTVEYHHRSAWQRAKNVERTCVVLSQSELDIAFGFSYGWLTPRL
jgi:hypothetical protein